MSRHLTGRRLVAALASLLLLLTGCAPADQPDTGNHDPGAGDAAPAEGPGTTPEPPVPDEPPREEREQEEPPPVDRSGLRATLETLLAAAHGELSEAELGLLVVAADGQVLLAHEPDRPMLPASTLKLVTAAAVLVTLGPDARLTTTVETTAPVDEDGVVRGDLHLAGTGDPLLATSEYGRWVYPARPRTPLDALADELAAVGVERVTGDVIAIAEGFTGPREAEGWRDTYFSDFDARRITGLTVDAGLEIDYTWPDPEDDPDAGDAGDADGSESDEADEDEADDADEPRDPDLEPERVRIELADDPSRQAAVELVRLLDERGVEVDGTAGVEPTDAPVVGTLARVESPPMHEVLRFMVQRSDNHIADTLLHVAGRVRTGEGSFERGERALLQVLDHLGVPLEGLRLADGSGLSRHDRFTAAALVELDRAMVAGRHSEVWRSLMAVAGEPGTLRTRLRATPAQGRLLAKTGSLRDVSSLSGFVQGDTGERHHFALVANEATGSDRAVIRALADDLALVLSSDLLACRTDVADGDDGPLGRPPLVVAC